MSSPLHSSSFLEQTSEQSDRTQPGAGKGFHFETHSINVTWCVSALGDTDQNITHYITISFLFLPAQGAEYESHHL